MRTVALLVVACLAVVVIGFAIRGCARGLDTNDVTAQDVASIEVVSEGVHQHTPPFPGVGRFVAAPEDHSRLLALVQGGEDAKEGIPWVVLGHMRIRLRDGREIGVGLYWTGQERGAYSTKYATYRGSSDEEIIRTFTECAKQGKPVGVTP